MTCGNEVNYPIGGAISVQSVPVLTTSDSRLTAVTATTTHSYTVVFMGAAGGTLKKGVVENEGYGFEYDTVDVDRGIAILGDMDLDISGEYLFIMTSQAIWKVKVHNCHGRQRCMECLNARDPYCGWCALENKCSIREECSNRANKHWLPYKDAQCTTISRVTPNKLQITSSRYLRLEVENLPTVSGQLSCVFTALGRSHLTGAQIDPEGILSCPTPLTNVLPRIPRGEHKIVVTLSVQIDEGPEFASTNFTFFDCSTYDSCSGCVQSPFPCDWCVESHQCTHNAEDDCRNDHIINGLNRQGVTTRRGPAYCPHISSATPEIYVPSGSKKSIVVQSKNILDFQKNFQCEFKIGYSVHKRAAKRHGDEIRCDEMEFSYFGNGADDGKEVAKFSVVWQSGKALDNVQNIRVIMYKCDRLANNCGLCLTLDSNKFTCGWCNDVNACTTEKQCGDSIGRRKARGEWLGRADVCPDPKIVDFNPKSGPVSGGTEVTITGINLGRSYQDVKDAVKINNVACETKEKEYEVSTKIVCVTGRPAYGKEAHGPVVVKLGEAMKYVTVSEDSFYFVDPVITGFEPREGPKAGGTDVVIRGDNLDAGSDVNGSIAGVPCQVRSRSANQLVCRTGRSTTEKSGAILMFFDNEKEQFVKQQFSFRSNPLVTSARPEVSISSGGIRIEFRGDNFNLLQRVRMFLSFAGDNYFSSELCDIFQSDRMLCKTPDLMIPEDDRLQPTVTRPLTLDYGLEMDGTLQNTFTFFKLRHVIYGWPQDFNRMKVFPDPKIEKFPDSHVRYFKEDDYLTINGQNLNSGAKEDDVAIKIGKGWCNLTALAAPALTCRPPPVRPDLVDEKSEHPEVLVTIGSKRFAVGFLSYKKEEKQFLGMSLITIIAIAVALGVFILALIGLLYAYRRKSTKHCRQMKSLKAQMDSIEMKVASECKEAFAELQTSMSEMTQEMNVGIPLLPYRDYSAQVLFPNSPNHPVLRDDP